MPGTVSRSRPPSLSSTPGRSRGGGSLKSIEYRRLSRLAYEAIRLAIRDMELRPGEHLVESVLAERLGTSSVPVREALLMLEGDGFISIVPMHGAFVNRIELSDLEEIFELRELLEGRASRHAAEHLPDPLIERLIAINDTVEQYLAAGDLTRCHDLFMEHDDIIFGATTNSRLGSTLRNLRDQVAMIGVVVNTLPGRLEISQRQHLAVIAAIRERSGEGAELAMQAHVRSIWADLRSADPKYLAVLQGDAER